jgi:predicted RNase H-like HicB family nuclease
MEEQIELWTEGDMWIIKHIPSGVTTQGDSRLHALLMLADALSGYTDPNSKITIEEDRELLSLAEEVFILSEEQKEFLEEFKNDESL